MSPQDTPPWRHCHESHGNISAGGFQGEETISPNDTSSGRLHVSPMDQRDPLMKSSDQSKHCHRKMLQFNPVWREVPLITSQLQREVVEAGATESPWKSQR
ncbi:uncharacterized protein GJ701_001964 [Geothlypis trichas]